MHFKEYRSILSSDNNMNIYRGCTHGCIYCDSRSKCYQIDHDFEDIEVKKDAPLLLDLELSKRKKACMIGTGSMSDPYNHRELELEYTRKCLQVIQKHHCGIAVLTKSNLILRDLDLLKKINEESKAIVQMTLTTADDNLCRLVEPNVCVSSERAKVLQRCYEEGIKTIVWLCPFLPYINDTKENVLKLLDYCSQAHVYGIIYFGSGVTLREGDREYFYQKLDELFPGLKKRYIAEFGERYEVYRQSNIDMDQFVKDECQKRNIICDNNYLFNYMHEYPKKFEQIDLFK